MLKWSLTIQLSFVLKWYHSIWPGYEPSQFGWRIRANECPLPRRSLVQRARSLTLIGRNGDSSAPGVSKGKHKLGVLELARGTVQSVACSSASDTTNFTDTPCDTLRHKMVSQIFFYCPNIFFRNDNECSYSGNQQSPRLHVNRF